MYIGEGGQVGERLGEQDRADNHTFWTETVVFTNKDGSVTKTHAQFVESELVSAANQESAENVANLTDPRRPPLQRTDRNTAQRFLNIALSCMKIVGVPFFKADSPSHEGSVVQTAHESTGVAPLTPDSELLFLRSSNRLRGETDATGYSRGNELVVQAGARAAKDPVDSASIWILSNRQGLIDDGYFIDKGDHYELVKDYAFPSPSAAAQALLGSSSNGRDQWKNADGKSLKDL